MFLFHAEEGRQMCSAVTIPADFNHLNDGLGFDSLPVHDWRNMVEWSAQGVKMIKSSVSALVLLAASAVSVQAEEADPMTKYMMLKMIPLYTEVCELDIEQPILDKIAADAAAAQPASGMTDAQMDLVIADARKEAETSPPDCSEGSADRKPFDAILDGYTGQ